MGEDKSGMRAKSVRLLLPPADAGYAKKSPAYPKFPFPPPSGHAILSAWAKRHCGLPDLDVKTMGDISPDTMERRSLEEMARFAKGVSIVGLTNWYHNTKNCQTLAKMVKAVDPRAIIVMGGPNCSDPSVSGLFLRKIPQLDYVVSDDGEDALAGLIRGASPQAIPNLCWLEGDAMRFSHRAFTDLTKMPLWDFTDAEGYEKLLKPHKELDRGILPMVSILSSRGCNKAVRMGPCHFCTSSCGDRMRIPPRAMFWEQAAHLHKMHGLDAFYVMDNVFVLSPEYVRRLAEERVHHAGVPESLRLRVYTYPTSIVERCQAEADMIGESLSQMGVCDVFFGIESFDREVNSRSNKEHFSLDSVERSIEVLAKHGIRTTLGIIMGLPGESPGSIAKTVSSLKQLLERHAPESFERLVISLGQPLLGTPWFHDLCKDPDISEGYSKAKGMTPDEDISPDYALLMRLSVARYSSSLSADMVEDSAMKIISMAREYLPTDMVGGYGLEDV